VTVNPLSVKGLGEIGIVSVVAAIAHAGCHATGSVLASCRSHRLYN
jgi:CO/xanthine dehydrogenase Mo-binding subunit